MGQKYPRQFYNDLTSWVLLSMEEQKLFERANKEENETQGKDVKRKYEFKHRHRTEKDVEVKMNDEEHQIEEVRQGKMTEEEKKKEIEEKDLKMQFMKRVDKTYKFVNNCKKDCLTMKKALERYGITDKGPKVDKDYVSKSKSKKEKEFEQTEDGKKEAETRKKKDMYVMNNPTEYEKNTVLKHIKLRL